MNFGQLKRFARAYIPGAKTQAVDDDNLGDILNEGALDIAARLQCMQYFDYFDAVANQETYSLSSVLSNYLSILESGVWFLNGTQYEDLDPETMRSLDNRFPNWRSDSGEAAERYAMLGNDIFIPHPKISTSISDAFLIYYAERPLTMSSDDDYPFHVHGNSKTERTDLSILSDLVLMFAEWKILKVLNKRDDSMEKFNEYLVEIENKKPLIRLRPDITRNKITKMSGPRVG